LLAIFLFIVSPLLGDIVDPTTAIKITVSAILLLLVVIAEHVAEQSKESGTTVFPKEDEAFDRLSEIVSTRPREVRMCEYSASSVIPHLKNLARFQETESVKLLICHPKKACDEPQKNRILGTLHNLSQTTYWSNRRLADRVSLTVKCYDSPASLRGRNFGNKYVAVGWYTHDCRTEGQTAQVWGDENSLIVTPIQDNEGEKLASMFNLVFDNLWEHALPLKDALADPQLSNDYNIDPNWVRKVSQDG
jgi:hypothetical protein